MLELFLEQYDIDIICITEHHLKNDDMNFNVKNYNVISSFNRKSLDKGGSLIFVKKNLKCKDRKDIVKLSVERIAELACVEMDKYIILSVYRPPLLTIKYLRK